MKIVRRNYPLLRAFRKHYPKPHLHGNRGEWGYCTVCGRQNAAGNPGLAKSEPDRVVETLYEITVPLRGREPLLLSKMGRDIAICADCVPVLGRLARLAESRFGHAIKGAA